MENESLSEEARQTRIQNRKTAFRRVTAAALVAAALAQMLSVAFIKKKK